MNKSIVFSLIILLGACKEAPAPVDTSSDCSCYSVMNEAIALAEEAYAGYFDKVNGQNQEEYDQYKSEHLERSTGISDPKRCYPLIMFYIDFFKDNHFTVIYTEPANPENKRTVEVNESDLLRDSSESIVGIWESTDHTYRFAVVPEPSEGINYSIVALDHPDTAFTKGTVVYELTNLQIGSIYVAHSYTSSFAITPKAISHQGNTLDFQEFKLIKKGSTDIQDQYNYDVELRKLNDTTFYARFPLFNQKEVKELDELLQKHLSEIKRTPNLILDIRNNEGGNGTVSDLVLELLYTDALISPAWGERISQPFLDLLKKRVEKGSYSEELYQQKEEMGIGLHTDPPDTIVIESTFDNPQRIAILMNEGCASSSEFFIYLAKQSSKVTLFGQPSSGTMDYGSTWPFAVSCDQFTFSVATSRNGWVDEHRIDKVGFQPDVEIPVNSDWVQFVQDYWEKNTIPVRNDQSNQ